MIRREQRDRVAVVTIDRTERRNALDPPTASALVETIREVDADDQVAVVVLTGAGGTFSAGADLTAITDADPSDYRIRDLPPMGITRLELGTPTIAAVEGYAMGGGFELALWCDLRVVAEGAIFAMAHRRWGLPTADGGSVRLPRMIGQGRAMDLILTGRRIDATEAERIGIVDRLVPLGGALDAAIELANELAALPQHALRHDRLAVLEQWALDYAGALINEATHAEAIVAAYDPSLLRHRAQ